MSRSDALRHWHELQVSQLELEVQSAALAELGRQKREAEQGLQRYAGLFDQAPVCYLALARDGCIAGANRAAAALFGMPLDRLPGQPVERFLAPASQPALRALLARLHADGSSSAIEAQLFESLGGGRVRIEANLEPAGGAIRMVLSDLRMRAQHHAEDGALRRAFAVLDTLGEGVAVADADGVIIAVNPAFSAISGRSEAQAIGCELAAICGVEAALAGLEEGGWQGELAGRRPDGAEFQAALSLRSLAGADGSVAGVVAVLSDISRRKQAESALQDLHRNLESRVLQRTAELLHTNGQLRQLSAHMASVKEEERKRIAREIHDELGQNLLALKLDIVQLNERMGGRQNRLARRVSSALANIDATLRSVRGIMNELRPAVLDLGLAAALEWLVNDFRQRSKLHYELALPGEAELAAINSETSLVLFRIVQEALVNVLRHARATRVAVRLEAGESGVLLEVEDNGIGIAPACRERPGSFGLIGMQERADALHGSFTLSDYEPGAGCRITLRLPL
ncbi:PAS domain S-box protein [Pseudoduganella sp. DS3]|uniref:PAS domain S-box protein n=1 Tax=Pseudoduganella guangdongensis TaxID=2692179 RepID=A0A6N9HIZ2_9BURK|nr:PAS domain-containing protein [Pseudoduganella guangdongensis]MYN02992.1 PAS domain S-box protein [Pseudoduganella guangdongensis]